MTKITDISSNSIDEVSGYDYVKNFSKRMLKTQLFTGTFQEKRFVGPLDSYRDVINIDRDEEEFIKNLLVVKKKIEDNFSKKPWIGITKPDTIGAPVGHNLWVILPQEVFGKYWFKVKTVEFLNNEIRLKLEIIRPVKKENSPGRNTSNNSTTDEVAFVESIKQWPEEVRQLLLYFYKNVLTFENTKQSVIFISLLIGTIFAGGANIIKYLLEYLLKLIRETSGFIKVCTPIIITCLNIMGKTIYGFYALIVALVYGKRQHQAPAYNGAYYNADPNNMIMYGDPRQRYNQYFNQRALPYPTERSSVRIRPLD